MAQTKYSQACSHRSVSKDGRVICTMIQMGEDNEVSPSLCRECPARKIACDHLRFSLQKITSRPITVRYATGRVEILDDQPPRIGFLRAACEEKVHPIHSPAECAQCRMHSMPAAPFVPAPAATPGVRRQGDPVPAARCSGELAHTDGRYHHG